jgi:ADP-heptose:LPS heptosyltransferase
MNYLIITFDGFGDGVIYQPFLKYICEKNPRSLFFCTSNRFLVDKNLNSKIGTLSNLRLIDDVFRKFSREYWDSIRMFITENKINTIINFRIIGRNFEPNYYEFKEYLSNHNTRVDFYDDESLADEEKLNVNIREIIKSLLNKAFNVTYVNTTFNLKSFFPPNDNASSIVINFHSRGTFKLWEPSNWSGLISTIVLEDKEVRIFDGHDEQEKLYTRKIVDMLSTQIQAKIKIVIQYNLYEIGKILQNTFLLVSVDSGFVHLADSIGINTLGIYVTTSPVMWGGVTDKFHYISSKHMLKCKNFYPYFGMCMNDKKKCEEILHRDDISVSDVLMKINKIYGQKN